MKDRPGPAAPEPARGAHVALALWAAAMTWILRLDDPRLRFPAFLGGAAVAIGAYLVLVFWARRGQLQASLWQLAVVFAIAARIGALNLPPAFSEDVFRYVFEGRVALWYGPSFPFVNPPLAAPEIGVDPALLDESWLRINHAHVPTLYPPLMQAVFVLGAGLGELFGGAHLFSLKVLLVIADLGCWLLIALTLRALGRRVEESAIWGLSPLVIVEIAREGHADVLSSIGLSLGIFGFFALRPRVGYLGFALAALAKLNGLIVLPAALRIERRGFALVLPLLLLLAWPFVFAGAAAGTGLSTYAESWRANDGAFSLILWIAELLLGGDWRDFGSFVLTRHQLARGLSGLAFAAIAFFLLKKPYARHEIGDRAAGLILFLLLLAPTLHPWYVLWLLPLAVFSDRWRVPSLVLAATVWLGHHAAWLELIDGVWAEVPWVRALVHVPVWFCIAVEPERRYFARARAAEARDAPRL